MWILKLCIRKKSFIKVLFEGAQDIKSSLRGAKLPNGQPMLLDEEQNSLALLIEQVCPLCPIDLLLIVDLDDS